ncbi:MAG TPA: hypothetical protein VGD40_16985 [Chryseosolibacter sp.]
MLPIYDNGYARSEYDEANQVVILHLGGMVNVEKTKDVFQKTMKFMETHHTTAVIYNGESLTGTFTQLNDYIAKEVSPFYDKQGVKYAITALSMDVFTRFAVNSLLKMLKTNREVKIVRTFGEAKAYLEAKMNVKLSC